MDTRTRLTAVRVGGELGERRGAAKGHMSITHRHRQPCGEGQTGVGLGKGGQREGRW